jgi:hypothetical protein
MMVEMNIPLVLDVVRTAGLLVAVFYYITTLRNQNKARQASLYQALINKFSSEELNKHYLNIAQEEWREKDNIIDELDPTNKDKYLSFCVVGSYYEGISVLIEENLLDLKPIATASSDAIKWYWETVQPYVEHVRKTTPKYLSKSEGLYHKILEYEKQHPTNR